MGQKIGLQAHIADAVTQQPLGQFTPNQVYLDCRVLQMSLVRVGHGPKNEKSHTLWTLT